MTSSTKLRSAFLSGLIVGAMALASGCASSTPRYRVAASVRVGTPGTYVAALPAGHRLVIVHGVRYHVHGGTYYRPAGHRWIIVKPPRR